MPRMQIATGARQGEFQVPGLQLLRPLLRRRAGASIDTAQAATRIQGENQVKSPGIMAIPGPERREQRKAPE